MGNQAEKGEIEKILQKGEIEMKDVLLIMELITSSKVKNKTSEIVREIQNRARRKLNLLPDVEPAKSMLFELVELFSDI